MDPELLKKKIEYEERKARAKALRLRLTCTICGAKPKTLLNCPCGTVAYCSTDCQRIDWRERGHKKVCKKIRDERAAEAARAEAPPSPPKEVFYGPAPRSQADEIRARIAAEHEAARARREANPEPEPVSARYGSRCPICFSDWDPNQGHSLRICCCRQICMSCTKKMGVGACPLCRATPLDDAGTLALLRRHVEEGIPEAIQHLGDLNRDGLMGLKRSDKKAAKLYKRAVELGDVIAMYNLGDLYEEGLGVKLDRKKAMQLWRMAAAKGYAHAQYAIGVGLQQQCRFAEAAAMFKPAADRGLAQAQLNLAVLTRSGLGGVKVDHDEARRLLERAAAANTNDGASANARGALAEYYNITLPGKVGTPYQNSFHRR